MAAITTLPCFSDLTDFGTCSCNSRIFDAVSCRVSAFLLPSVLPAGLSAVCGPAARRLSA